MIVNFDQVINLAETLCSAVRQPAYVSLKQITDERTKATLGQAQWVGVTDAPPNGSRAAYFAEAKAAELVWNGPDNELMLTPTTLSVSPGFKGGVRLGNAIIGVSKWDEKHDLLLALILMYSLQNTVTLHHAGFHYPTYEALMTASKQEGGKGINRPSESSIRLYHQARSVGGDYYRELIHYPHSRSVQDTSVHWDVVVDDPNHFLSFIARPYGQRPVLYETDINSPAGCVMVLGTDGSVMGIMARNTWTRVEDWD